MTAEVDSTQRPYVVLAALAFDETGEWVLTEAARVAERRNDSELHVVHVVVDDGGDSGDHLRALDRRLARAPGDIKECVDRVWKDLARPMVAHIRTGGSSRTILQTAIDIDADLVVVGSHQRGGLDKLILGSVAERVLHHAHCPVLVALPKNYEGASKTQGIEPACGDCLVTRRKTKNVTFWCERHSRTQAQVHVYEPSDRPRNSVMPTY
jgi:nucleotide-binding universal stress UspA family protein